ncbi:hypothetical protein C8R48DRAFT_768943 [Suillus tomentosus]|nr:hypothetical protein C8R48DRAFT_768943 [Suillus tomentosus]
MNDGLLQSVRSPFGNDAVVGIAQYILMFNCLLGRTPDNATQYPARVSSGIILVGANPKFKSMYQFYQIFICLLKFDFFCFVGATMQLLIVVLSRESAEFGITIAAIPVVLFLLAGCARAVKYEVDDYGPCIDGGCNVLLFLDILLRADESRPNNAPYGTRSTTSDNNPLYTSDHKQEPEKAHSRKLLFTVRSGGFASYLASLCGKPPYVDIQAKTDTYVGFLPAHALERLVEKRPIVQLTLAKRLISLLSPLVLQIDASLDWMHVNAGQVLWRPEDISDSFYIVINGLIRFRGASY